MKTFNSFAVSTLVIAISVIGCKPASELRPMTNSALAPSLDPRAEKAAGRVAEALKARNSTRAVAEAELAVGFQPRNADYRMLLGQAYMLAGRFASAATAFRDTLALRPSHGRAALNLALAELALGRPDAAKAALATARGAASDSDVGLALALAGDKDGAIALLETAARAEGASPRTRQNLALAYALAGRWKESHIIAAQDVPANELAARMLKWALIAKPRHQQDQIAILLGVNPVEDPGQPVALALAPMPVEQAAATAIATLDVAAPASPPVLLSPAAPVGPAEMQVAEVEAAAVPAEPVAAPAPVQTSPSLLASDTQIAAPAPSVLRADPKPAVEPVSRPVMMVASAPVKPQPIKVAMPAKKPLAQTPRVGGNFVVQLGAFSSAERVSAAWGKYSRRAGYLGGYTPVSNTVRMTQRGAVLHRLAVSGFATRAEAAALCRQVRAGGGSCFVRGHAGDAPIQWVRNEKADKPVALAAR